MLTRRLIAGICAFCTVTLPVFATTYTVSQNGNGQFTSIQAAVNSAGRGDEIVILDAAVYYEQVTIDSTRHELVLRSVYPRASLKPTILYQDKKNVGPTTCAEAKDTSKITWDRNGAVQVLGAAGVRIEGIIVDGGGVYPFGYDGIWREDATDCKWPLQYGNAAITLWIAGEAIIRNCDIRNAYFGINVKDRNEGGIFGNANPGDVYPENVVPLSGFARTGNHLIEHNRVHDNSFGLYFESSWDLGSTVRYNLIYENHHPDGVGEKVKALTSDGANQPGGAFMLKDDLLSPLAIYNNTFWHNMFIFVGGWNCAGIHLVFNNIFAEPYIYWGKESVFGGQGWQELSVVFTNRMYSCVFAAQQQAPDPSYVSIMRDMGQPNQEGDLIPATYPAAANVRWLESHFLSVSPASADFLMPDWNNVLVQQYIVDQGWATSGVKDPDGSPADLGAIPMGGGQPVDVATIRQTRPVLYTGTTANVSFSLTPRIGTIDNPKIVFIRVVRNLDTVSNYGNDCPLVAASKIVTVAFPNAVIMSGSNEFLVTVTNPGNYAFFELFIEGTGSDGQPFTSAAGFVSCRKLDYIFDVGILDQAGGKQLTEVRAGTPVVLHVDALTTAGVAFTNKVDPTNIKLYSRFNLLTPAGTMINSVPGGITGSADFDILFTRVPAGGAEFVTVAGKWVDASRIVPFLGSSGGIRILPGPADSILFQDPPSGMTAKVDPGTTWPVRVRAFDKYGNRIDSACTINCISTNPDIGNIVVKDVLADTTGMALFRALVINGDANDTFMIIATLNAQPAVRDTAYMVVGDPTAVIPHAIIPVKARETRCEVIDLCGRVVKRFTVGSNFTTRRNSPFPATAGRGIYLIRMTDGATGKVTMKRRIVLGR